MAQILQPKSLRELKQIIAMMYDELLAQTQVLNNIGRCVDDLHTYHMNREEERQRVTRMATRSFGNNRFNFT
jgi:hypothetical protein